VSLGFTGCFFDGEEYTNKNRIFEAEPSELISVDSAVVLEKYEPTVSLKKVEPEDVGFEISLTSQQDPVEVSGQNTQASDVLIWGSHAIVSYNTAGDVFNGAIQWVNNFVKDSTEKNNSPEIDREVHLEGYDVNVIFLEGANLYVGGAVVVKDQVRYFLSYFKVNKGELSELLENMVYYDSYGVTSLVAIDEGLFVSVGADSGGVHLVNSETLVSEKFWAEEDVRSMVSSLPSFGNN
jgi:hypothetical protein